ncbi:hypothetical protein MINT15_27170 [Saccharomonospora viridis]|uniref:Uncharacterized protein n=1 Tax=Saccharomonospora viridis TaxID=1852 RepID=A0A837D5M0_9PSEU|nr:hypothetical protein MINT15_27170 [Saccharomonospora viridis]
MEPKRESPRELDGAPKEQIPHNLSGTATAFGEATLESRRRASPKV